MKTVCQLMYDAARGPHIPERKNMPYDPNDGSNPNICGAPWNEDDEGNCECTGCRKIRYKEAKAEYDADHGPDAWEESRMGWDELSHAGRQRRVERKIEAAEFRRDEKRDEQMMRGAK
jgi:hypothetical protein